MKTGRTLSQLAAEIERQANAKKDFVADTRKLELVPAETGASLVINNGSRSELAVKELTHRQIGDRVGVPAKYYDRMLTEAPQLLAANVNHWFREQPETRMIRTLDGSARAFLSNRYQRIDNVHVAETVLPILSETPGIEVMSCEITESRLYIKAVTHAVQREVKSRRVGDLVEAGVMISNSEVGLGAVRVSPFFHFLVCLNGMVRNKEGLKASHVGTRFEGDDEQLAALLADDTRRAMDRAVILKVRDVVRSALDKARFEEAIRQMQDTTQQKITGDPAAAIELLSDELAIGDGERASVLRHLIEGGDLSRYGVMNAVTRTAADLDSYDRATEFETMGGRILDLAPAQWQRIAVAA